MLRAKGTLKTRSDCSPPLFLHGGCSNHLGCIVQDIPCLLVAVLPAGHQQAQPQFEMLLSKSPGTLHPLHALQIDSLMPLVNCCRARQDHQVLQTHRMIGQPGHNICEPRHPHCPQVIVQGSTKR